jgi:predicted RNase H-like HicB family nuclease
MAAGASGLRILPGCAAWGHNKEEALTALKDTAEIYIEDMKESGV